MVKGDVRQREIEVSPYQRRRRLSCFPALTGSRRTDEHSHGFHQKNQSDGTGELLRADDRHENLKLESPHHPVRDAEEHTEDHQGSIVVSLNGERHKTTEVKEQFLAVHRGGKNSRWAEMRRGSRNLRVLSKTRTGTPPGIR